MARLRTSFARLICAASPMLAVLIDMGRRWS